MFNSDYFEELDRWIPKFPIIPYQTLSKEDVELMKEERLKELKLKYSDYVEEMDKEKAKKVKHRMGVSSKKSKRPNKYKLCMGKWNLKSANTAYQNEFKGAGQQQNDPLDLMESKKVQHDGIAKDLLVTHGMEIAKPKQAVTIDMTFVGRIDGTPFDDSDYKDIDDSDGFSLFQLSYTRLPGVMYTAGGQKAVRENKTLKIHPNSIYNLPKEVVKWENSTLRKKVHFSRVYPPKDSPKSKNRKKRYVKSK